MNKGLAINTIEELYESFEALSTEGGWHRKFPALWPEPEENFLPYIWQYEKIKPVLMAAGELVAAENAERRNLTMRNPVAGNRYATVRTIVAAYQMIQPGEVAKSHRHTPNALRLILEGKGTYTVVDGKRIEMCPGDVLLTPSWSWHSHECVGTEDCYWMDFLDVPLVHLLEPMFFERHPDGLESNIQDLTEAPLVFRWRDTLQNLDAAGNDDFADADEVIELGSPALDSIALYMLRLSAGSSSTKLQTTANSIFAVIQGKGKTTIDGNEFHWSFGDTIVVPAWRPYQHFASSDAVLLRVTDTPVMEKFNWLRTKRFDA
jgi:gentisate 1,2-dioxygenase